MGGKSNNTDKNVPSTTAI